VGHHDRAVNANTKSGTITVRNPYFCDRTHRVPPNDANSSGLFLTLRRSEDYVAPSPAVDDALPELEVTVPAAIWAALMTEIDRAIARSRTALA